MYICICVYVIIRMLFLLKSIVIAVNSVYLILKCNIIIKENIKEDQHTYFTELYFYRNIYIFSEF